MSLDLILDGGLPAFVASRQMPPVAPPKGHAGAGPDYISPDGAEIRLILRPEVEGVRHQDTACSYGIISKLVSPKLQR